MAKASKALHLLTARQVHKAAEDCADGGGLLLRVSSDRASWVLRYTAPTDRPAAGVWARRRA